MLEGLNRLAPLLVSPMLSSLSWVLRPSHIWPTRSCRRKSNAQGQRRVPPVSCCRLPGSEVDRLPAMAGKYKTSLVMGVIERDGYTLYCTVPFLDAQGHYLGKYKKLMPTSVERIVWGFGDGSNLPIFDSPIGKIGADTCWENRMPQALMRSAMYGKGDFVYLLLPCKFLFS